MIEILKCVVYTVLGCIMGLVLGSALSLLVKILSTAGIICILVLIVILIMLSARKKTAANKRSMSSIDQNARISRSSSVQKTSYSAPSENRIQQDVQVQSNPLDRKPMSAEKKELRSRNRVPATKIVLLNEEGRILMEWSLERQTSLIIGKGSEKEPVDIDLSGSAVAQMISKQHAVLNYTEKGWFIDDIDSKNGTRVKKATQNSIMDVKLVGAIEVETGDIIYIANTMLQIQ